ncbi:hypothetical protein CFP56_029124 [Quercus suber]|uniref:Uncharacterized protein n=1 Tax=Quercus suber TaxID=58331 RepID=A0AAW0MBN9_QUESU
MGLSSTSTSTALLLLLLLLLLFPLFATLEGVDLSIKNQSIVVTPSPLPGISASRGSKDVLLCERVQVSGVSRLKLGSYASAFRVTFSPSLEIPERLHSKIQVCFHKNNSLDLCQCENDKWKSIKELGSSVMSPYDDRYIDVKFIGEVSGYVTIAIVEDFQRWRLVCLTFGFVLLLLAPIVSNWVPFYYSSSMAIGVFLVIIILLFQGMKLLPTGRKNFFYLTMYGSVLGAGSFLMHHFSVLVNSILINFGLSEEMHNPVSSCVDLSIKNQSIVVTPSPLPGISASRGSKDVLLCERVQVSGVSRLKLGSYASAFRVTFSPSLEIPERLHSKIQVCFHKNNSLGLCQCENDKWKSIKELGSSVMSPYDDRYIDVKFIGEVSGYVTIAIVEDFQRWRLVCLTFGFVLLLLAPIVSNWVPFYYSSSMAIGVFLVIIILLFQGMKLLPTGRKNFFYLTMYGSVLGAGSFLMHHFSVLVNSILINFGLSEEMHNPVSSSWMRVVGGGWLVVFYGHGRDKLMWCSKEELNDGMGSLIVVIGAVCDWDPELEVDSSRVSLFVLVGIVLAGAALGYWIVRKFVISKDGGVDVGIAQFVKWAMRIIGTTSILQSSLDTPLALVTLASCWAICNLIFSMKWPGLMYQSYSGNGSPWLKLGRQTTGKHNRAEFLSRSSPQGKMWNSPKKPSAWSNSPIRGVVSPSSVAKNQQEYYSTFHSMQNRKKFTKKEWDDFTRESTRQAMAEWASSPEFADWMIDNADRIQLLPGESSDETMGSGSDSTNENVVGSRRQFSFFNW